jgi:hypothetical protein
MFAGLLRWLLLSLVLIAAGVMLLVLFSPEPPEDCGKADSAM